MRIIISINILLFLLLTSSAFAQHPTSTPQFIEQNSVRSIGKPLSKIGSISAIEISTAGTSSAASTSGITWTNGGGDNIASNPLNWSEGSAPQNSDSVFYDNTSTADCTWDLSVTPTSININSGYTGTFNLNADLSVIDTVTIADGKYNLNDKKLTIGFDPPTATTNTASSTNGDTATLYATVNPNGLETVVYFECRTGATYDISTSPQSIGSGTTNVSVSETVTGLSPGAIYFCRIAMSNAASTVYGNDVSFTTSSITVYISSPLHNDLISRPDVMVRGTVTNSTGNETGITVNGKVAVVYNGEFFVNHVPLQDGQNTITANAVDSAGNTALHSVYVNAAITDPHVTLRNNLESGIAPLTAYFSVSTEIPNSVASYSFDYEGDGTTDFTDTTFEDISVTYSATGVYYPTIAVTDDQSNTYTDSIAIIILNQTELDALLRAKWEGMRNSLSIRDITTALTYISSDSRASYQEIFNYLTDQLPSIVATQTAFNLNYITDNLAKYELVTNESNTTYSYEVVFIKDENGIWVIMDF